MSVADMRGEIRDSVRAVNKAAQKAIITKRYGPIIQASAMVRKLPLNEVTDTDRETLIYDTQELWAWLCGLRGVPAGGQK
jgi:hypothetical protein